MQTKGPRSLAACLSTKVGVESAAFYDTQSDSENTETFKITLLSNQAVNEHVR